MTIQKWEQAKSWIREFTIEFKQKHGKKMLISKIKKEERAMSMLRKSMAKVKKKIELIETTIQHKKDWLTSKYATLQKSKHESYSSLKDLHHEKATKPYFALERKMRLTNDRVITEMKGIDNWSTKTFNKTKDILTHAARPYYKKLHNKKVMGDKRRDRGSKNLLASLAKRGSITIQTITK